MMPLFQEARDVLPAITQMQAKLHNIDLTLADRMDRIGAPEQRKAYDESQTRAALARAKETC